VSTMTPHELVATRCICCDGDNLSSTPAIVMPFVAWRVFGHTPVEITPEWGMRDLKTGTSYTVCRSLECRDCGVVFLDDRFTDAQMASLYEDYRDERYLRERIGYEPGFVSVYDERHAYLDTVEEWLAPHVPARPAVLDFGGSDGANSPFLGRAEYLHIHDISGVETVDGTERADPARFGTVHYDLVSCIETLEHVPWPADTLAQVIPALDENSLFYVEMPYEELMTRELPFGTAGALKHHWHEHINFYSRESVRTLLRRAGLEIVAEHQIPVDIGYGVKFTQGYLTRLARN